MNSEMIIVFENVGLSTLYVLSKKSKSTFGLIMFILAVLFVSPIERQALRRPFRINAKNWFLAALSVLATNSFEMSFQWFCLVR